MINSSSKKIQIANICKQFSTLLLPVIVTILLSQAYYSSNVLYQVKIEAEKDIYISQMETFNALNIVRKHSALYSFRHKAYVATLTPHIFVDEFGNYIGRNNEKDSISPITFVDSVYKVPLFVCKVSCASDFQRCMQIIRANSMKLDSNGSRQSNEFIAFVDEHPIPQNKTRTAKMIVESGWTSEQTQKTYNQLLETFYNTLKEKVDKFEVKD